MEVPCLLFLKSACQCVVNQVTSSAGKEIALQEGVVNDAKFLSEELEEMLKYLVNVERDEASEVVDVGSSEDVKEAGGWVDKIRDTACDIHDCLQDLGPHGVEGLSLQNLWWATLASRHKVAAELKDLVSQVSRLSERKERYQRAGGRMVRRPAVWKEEAWLVVPDIDWRVDLGQLLARPDDSLVVIAVWLMTDPAAPAAGGARAPCLISDIFDDAERFQCRAWVTATHSVSVTDFLRALVRQLLANDSAPASLGALCDTEAMGTEELMKAAEHHLGEKRYLVVIEDVCTRPVWDWIKLFFPNDRNRSRLIVTSRRADVARHCAGRPTRSFMLERVLDDDARVYVSSDQGATASGISVVIQIEPYSEFIGRKKDVAELTRWISENVTEPWPISVYGPSGVGKSTLVRKVVYESPDLSSEIQRRAWITMMQPFNQQDFLRSIISQFQACSSLGRSTQSEINIQNMSEDELVTEISQLAAGDGRSLVIIDRLSAQEEWDQVKSCLWNDGDGGATCTVIVTTTNAAAAHHCSGNSNNMYKLSPLDSAAVRQLFYQTVFQHDGLIELCGPMVDHANHIIEKCDGNLLAIRIVSGLLGTKIRKSTEWEKLLNRLSSMLKDNPDLGIVSAAAKLSYDDLPSHMKYLLQYLSIFPRGRNLMRRRLARAWIAETYCRNARGYDAEEVEKIFNGLVMMSMIHPSKRAEITSGRINGCIVDDVFQQLGVSDAKLRDFIYILDEHPLDTNPTNSKIRHLVITVGWRRHDDERIDEFKKLDLSCARSLTVCGEWKSCFISTRMKLLRVLDLEDTEGLEEHHDLEQIGEFRHLKCLGLRNTGIAHLPNSLGKLLGLEELDIKGTYIAKLPSTVIHLTRLRRLHGGTVAARNARLDFVSEITRDCPGIIQSAASSAFCMCLLCLFKRKKPYGVRVPEKIGELKSVLTLGTIDVAGSRRVMKELQKLTQLQKLGVTGVTKHNTKHLCSTLERLHQLRSLMVDSSDSLSRLDTVCSPPLRLEALKLYGSLGTLPRWIKTLHNLHKLCLRSTLLDGDSVQVIAKLPNLIVLRLLAKSLVAEAMEFGSDAFPKLELLQIDGLENLMSLSFQGGAAPNLEILQIADCNFISEDGLRQFHDLPRIKKVSLDGVLVQKRPPHTSIPQGQAALVLNAGRRMRHTQAHVIRAAFRFKEAARRENSEIQE
ncbi:disease resistance protein RPM1-like isoform X1 [Triticum urartu]|uniref:disease resistance protein RPM1-like isoform X1 n=1 Tax=Triticum urartu TaxID=4572 RepID=UPI0020438071|nr:disease resistance protein RPM1-like isoform X1 [Triticum urartu]